MTRSEFGLLVDGVWRAAPELFQATPDRPPEPGAASRLGRRLGAVLPADYVWFLHEYGGGAFGRTVVFSADERSPHDVCRNQPTPRRPDFVAITTDGAGSYLGFPVVDAVCPDRIMRLDARADRLGPIAHPGFLAYLAAAALAGLAVAPTRIR